MNDSSDLRFLLREASNDQNRKRQEEAARLARRHWNEVQHPLNGLGLLEDVIVQIASLTQNADIFLDKKAVVIFCADNGVTKEGVTQTDSSVTGIVATSIAQGRSPVCHMAAACGIDVIPVDMGMKDFPGERGVLDRRIANGTNDILDGPAMSYKDAINAISTGIVLAGELKRQGYQLLGAGEMGIGNTTTASACASVLLGQDPAEVTGKGAGLSDQGLEHKIEVIREAIVRNDLSWKESPKNESYDIDLNHEANDVRTKKPCSEDDSHITEVLQRVGGFDILGMCGLFLGGWVHQIPVLIDGFASSVAALAAVRICPDCSVAVLASHLSSEPAAKLVLRALGKEPLITAGLHLGEGTGAVLAMPMLDMALAVYRDSDTFEEGGVKAYQPL